VSGFPTRSRSSTTKSQRRRTLDPPPENYRDAKVAGKRRRFENPTLLAFRRAIKHNFFTNAAMSSSNNSTAVHPAAHKRRVHLAEHDGQAQAAETPHRMRPTSVRAGGQSRRMSRARSASNIFSSRRAIGPACGMGLNAAQNNPHVRHGSPCRDDVPTRRGNASSLPTGASRESSEKANRHKTRSASLPVRAGNADAAWVERFCSPTAACGSIADRHTSSDSLISVDSLIGATVRERSIDQQ
jgi:hypothetical protein